MDSNRFVKHISIIKNKFKSTTPSCSGKRRSQFHATLTVTGLIFHSSSSSSFHTNTDDEVDSVHEVILCSILGDFTECFDLFFVKT